MNSLSYKFKKEGGLTPSYAGGFEVFIDGKETNNIFDEAGFILSAEQDGIFPMIVGTCQTFGCCGLYVSVKKYIDKVIWEKFWHGQCGGTPEPNDELKEFMFTEDFTIKSPMEFDRAEYTKLAALLHCDVKKIPDINNWFSKRFERYKAGDRAA